MYKLHMLLVIIIGIFFLLNRVLGPERNSRDARSVRSVLSYDYSNNNNCLMVKKLYDLELLRITIILREPILVIFFIFFYQYFDRFV